MSSNNSFINSYRAMALSPKVQWLISSRDANLAKLADSNLASIRLRSVVSMQAALDGRVTSTADREAEHDTEILVVGKVDAVTDIHRPARWLSYMQQAKAQHCKIILDYTDHHIDGKPVMRDFYLQALTYADHVTTSSPQLAKNIGATWKGGVTVIEDPIEVNFASPKIERTPQLTALWFGHASNLQYLFDFIKSDWIFSEPLRLIVMTNFFDQKIFDQQMQAAPKHLEMVVVPWSLQDMQTVAGICDFCIIPAGMNDARKNGVSSNRLLTALALGLPTAADRVNSYLSFSEYFTDIRSKNMEQLISQPHQYSELVKKAQSTIAKTHTIEAIGQQWLTLFASQSQLLSLLASA